MKLKHGLRVGEGINRQGFCDWQSWIFAQMWVLGVKPSWIVPQDVLVWPGGWKRHRQAKIMRVDRLAAHGKGNSFRNSWFPDQGSKKHFAFLSYSKWVTLLKGCTWEVEIRNPDQKSIPSGGQLWNWISRISWKIWIISIPKVSAFSLNDTKICLWWEGG